MKLKRLEAALLLAVLLVFTYASAAGAQQQALSRETLRLHVLANSDSAEDQRVKLCVRDRILQYTAPLLQNATTQAEVRRLLAQNLQAIVNEAQLEVWRQGATQRVTAQLRAEYYPTRVYTDFSLPAGQYVGLRVKLGAAEGRNWWCVIFPPLCDGAAKSETAHLTAGERALTREDGTQYVLRFKTAELVGEMRHLLGLG